jgi:hypothetical protein
MANFAWKDAYLSASRETDNKKLGEQFYTAEGAIFLNSRKERNEIQAACVGSGHEGLPVALPAFGHSNLHTVFEAPVFSLFENGTLLA